MSEWISVKDRLPEKRQKVLVFSRGGLTLGYTNPMLGTDFIVYEIEGVFRSKHVTHWMPIPSSPKQTPEVLQ